MIKRRIKRRTKVTLRDLIESACFEECENNCCENSNNEYKTDDEQSQCIVEANGKSNADFNNNDSENRPVQSVVNFIARHKEVVSTESCKFFTI